VAVVPTHLYGLPCDMASIVGLARRHGVAVIEDCAHALGAKYRGRSVGTFGDAAFFSLDVRQPLNTYGGGIAVARDAAVLARVRQQAEAEPWPGDTRVRGRLRAGTAQRLFSRPWVFTLTRYPALLAGTLGQARSTGSRGEAIRPLDPMPAEYHERYTNVQAAIGLASLRDLDSWNAATRAHARILDEALAGLPGVSPPFVPEGCEHVYCRYSVYAPDRDALVRGALRRGVDLETSPADLWPAMARFGRKAYAPYAAQAGPAGAPPGEAARGHAGARPRGPPPPR